MPEQYTLADNPAVGNVPSQKTTINVPSEGEYFLLNDNQLAQRRGNEIVSLGFNYPTDWQGKTINQWQQETTNQAISQLGLSGVQAAPAMGDLKSWLQSAGITIRDERDLAKFVADAQAYGTQGTFTPGVTQGPGSGGYVDPTGGQPSDAAQTQPIFDPATGTWSQGGQPIAAPPTVSGQAPGTSAGNAQDPVFQENLRNLVQSGARPDLAGQISGQESGQKALEYAKSLGEAPQDAGEARAAVSDLMPQGQATFYKPTTPVPGFDPNTVFDAQGRPLSYDQFIAAGGKEDFSNVVAGSPPPAADGRAVTPQKPAAMASPVVNATLETDPGYQQLLATRAEYNSVANQSASLLDFYNKAIKDAGIEGINAELINSKKIIEGTEDDIRSEVQATGGFATDSQVMALANARNKQLIKNYNALLDTKAMAMETVNNMVNLAAQDRAFALDAITQKLQIDLQIADYRDRFIQNAREGYNNIINAVGYEGLYGMLQNDPSALALAEQTLGLGQGQLQGLTSYIRQQENLAMLSERTITSPYVTLPNGTVMDARTGYEFNSQEDFRARTGQTIQDAVAQGQVQELPLTQEQEDRLFQRELDLARLGLEKQRVGLEGARVRLAEQELALETQQAFEQKQQQQIQQLSQSQGQINLTNSLINDSNLDTAVGTSRFGRFSPFEVFTGGKSNFIAGVEQLRSNLNLESLIQAKSRGATFGALSDQELRVLANAASKIGSWAITDDTGKVIGYKASENDFRKELNRINNFAKLDYVLKGGNPTDVGVQQQPDGSLTTLNSDGSVTQIYP